MKALNKSLSTIVLASTVLLGACGDIGPLGPGTEITWVDKSVPAARVPLVTPKPDYIEGIVTEEKYIPATVITKDTAAFGNATMQIGESKYSFALQTKDGMYFVSVADSSDHTTKETTDLAVNVGTHVKITHHYSNYRRYDFADEPVQPGSTITVTPSYIVVLPLPAK
jgi:major membrane immunogen (membrane-anchored lipoprotein)